jgi:hypothetical protein
MAENRTKMEVTLHEELHYFYCNSPLFIGNKIFATETVETNKIIICCQAHLFTKSYGSRDKTNANERTTVVTHCLDICSTLSAGLSGCIVTLYLKMQYTSSHNLSNHIFSREMAS